MPAINVVNFMSNVDGSSWIHRLDPRTKIAVMVFFSTVPLLFTDPLYFGFFIVLALPLWLTAKLNLRSMSGPLMAVGIFLVTIFILSLTRSRAELSTQFDYYSQYSWYVALGPLVITSHSVEIALFRSLRLAVPLTIGLLLIATTDPSFIAKGMRKLKMPIAIVFMVLAGLRFIPIVTEQLFNILDAQTIRGVAGSRWQRVKLLLLPLLISSLRRTRTMGLSCEARGFGAYRWDNFVDDFKFGRIDRISLVSVAVLTVAAVVVRFGFGFGTALIGTLK